VDIWLLPDAVPAWVTEKAVAASEHAKPVSREGAGPGSLTDEGLRYSVLDGHGVLVRAPDIQYWVQMNVPALASAVVGEPLCISPDVRTAINVNLVDGIGGSYEWHTDPCPWSALIFCTAHKIGGGWEANPDDVTKVSIRPEAGSLLVFRGSIPHYVQPLLTDERRVSIPIALYPLGTTSIERDPELDAHIFGETT